MLDTSKSDEPPPPEYAERGWEWPPRIAAESFFSYGVFGGTGAGAMLHGIVLGADRRTVAETGQTIVVATVRLLGFKVCVCLPGDRLPTNPVKGNVIGGDVYLVGSMPGLVSNDLQPRSRRGWLRRRGA